MCDTGSSQEEVSQEIDNKDKEELMAGLDELEVAL